MKLLVKKLNEKAILPQKKRNNDEGYDIFSIESKRLFKETTTMIHTGIAAAAVEVEVEEVNGEQIPSYNYRKYWLQIEGRSGLASKGVFPVGGVVDCGYNGEICVLLTNCSDSDYYIKEGDKIAQLIPRLHLNFEVIEVESLEESDRGENGFGSSGR
jgi:dUTP pyrophosphatase